MISDPLAPLPDNRTPEQKQADDLVETYRMTFPEMARIWRDIDPAECESWGNQK